MAWARCTGWNGGRRSRSEDSSEVGATRVAVAQQGGEFQPPEERRRHPFPSDMDFKCTSHRPGPAGRVHLFLSRRPDEDILGTRAIKRGILIR